MAESNTFCLRLDEFEYNTKTSWRELQIETDFCDVSLACEDKQIKAHKVIISACSPVLRNILKKNQNTHPLIYLRRVKYKDLLNLVSFMYQGEVNIAEEDLSSFLEVAEDLTIRGLSEGNTEGVTSFMYQGEVNIAGGDLSSFLEVAEDLTIRGLSEGNREGVTSKLERPPPANHLATPKKKRTIEKIQVENIKIKELSSIYPLNEFEQDYEDFSGNYTKGFISKTENRNRKTKQEKYGDKNQTLVSLLEEKKFPCEKCDFKSKHKVHLKVHIESVHEGIRHPCDQCDFKATSKSVLKRHIDTMHEGVRYPCDQCKYKTTEKSRLRNHLLKYHINADNIFA